MTVSAEPPVLARPLWRPIARSRIARVLWCILTGWSLSFSYRAINELRPPQYDFSTPLDAHIPFIPLTGLVYWSYYFLFVGRAWTIRPERFYGLWRAVMLTNAIAYVGFWFATAHVPHPDVSAVEPQWLGDLYRNFYTVDGPGNTLPSLHAALSLLLGWEGRKHHWGWLAWAVAISLATLTTKEHVLMDMIAGWALAGMVYWRFVGDAPAEA